MQQAPLLVVSAACLEAAGLFSAAGRIPLQLTMLPLIVRASTFPLLSSFWVSDRARFARLLNLMVNGCVIVVVPMVLLVAGLNRTVIGVIFGSAYLGATTPFVLLMVMVGLMTPCILVGEAMIAAGFQRVNLVIILLASVLLVGLLMVLVPRGGATGASAALVACWCFVAVTTFTVARRRLGVAIPVGAPLAAVAAAWIGVLVGLVASRTGEIPSAILSAAAAAVVICALRPTATGQLAAVVQRLVRRSR
jgi:O-antigen/teichoic acid export membrane protein